MASKLISVKKEAYERLISLKRPNDSFSDVILEYTPSNKSDLSDIIGLEPDFNEKLFWKSRKRTKEDDKRERLLLGH